MKQFLLVLIILSPFFGFTQKKDYIKSPTITYRKTLPMNIRSEWQHLDIEKDTIPGLSLYKAKKSIGKAKSNEIIIAVLDTQLDINHEAIKPFLWTNNKEIPNNGIDDDHNGYIDDINGWNFLANSKGESILNSDFECKRIINHFKKHPVRNKKDSLLLAKAKESEKGIEEQFTQEKARVDYYKSVYPKCYATIKNIFPKSNYTIKQLDSLLKIHESDSNRQLFNEIYLINELKKYNLDSTWVNENIKDFDYNSKTIYNKDYNEKEITGDNPEDIKDSIYGYSELSKFAKKSWHSTQVSGVIASCLNLFPNTKIKLMPIVAVAPKGEENNKDVAIAIRYAVNNGAKVINMSFGNDISLDNVWVREAFLYAEKRDVILIAGAGNNATNIDKGIFYPIDYDEETNIEFCANSIKVGGVSHELNSNFLHKRSNYGKKNVDVFAPAVKLYVPDATENYKFNGGTSLASALTSAVAALVRSYFPKLSAAQVKQILLDSSVKYDLEVQVPGEKEGTLQPFSQLSKSGGVVNAYNALLMAAEYSKKRKK